MDNPNNVLIGKDDVESILNYFGNIGNDNQKLCINNLEYYRLAFVHESYYQAQIQNRNENGKIYLNYYVDKSNETLEFLGDHILKSTLGRYLFDRYANNASSQREGFLTKLKIKIEKCSMLHKMALTLGFKRFLLLSLQIENQSILDTNRGRNTPSYYEDAFESFLGAIIMDFGEMGYIYADRFVRNVIENVVDFSELIYTNDNFKDSLQRYFQSMKWKTPVYQSIKESGPMYRKIFTRILFINHEEYESLSETQKQIVYNYTERCLDYYKTTDAQIFSTLFNKFSENGYYILCVGEGRKIISAEQESAKTGLLNLGIDLNY